VVISSAATQVENNTGDGMRFAVLVAMHSANLRG